MTQKMIQELSLLKGGQYLDLRNEFLNTAPPLPEYSKPLSEHDVRYRVQYMILHGWQNNAPLYNQINAELDDVNTDWLKKTNNGFFPVWNKFAKQTQENWKTDALPYAWETLIKLDDTMDEWRIVNSVFMIEGHPHETSIDPLLLAIHLEQDESDYANYFEALRKLPKPALQARLNETGEFYTFVRPILTKVLARL